MKLFSLKSGAVCAACLVVLAGCTPSADPDTCRVMVESGEHFTVAAPVRDVVRGESVTFSITPEEGYFVTDIDCAAAYTLQENVSSVQLTLTDVRYPTLVRVEVNSRTILYDANGGTLLQGTAGESTVRLTAPTTHLRANTALGTQLFARAGYVLYGWNTRPDGTGQHIGVGSRIDYQENLTLYAAWARANPSDQFVWVEESGGACITQFLGRGETLVVPETLGGLPVRRIASHAFAGCEAKRVILPASLTSIRPYAFADAALQELYLYDHVSDISDAAFFGCSRLQTLHLNAADGPVYSGSYFDAFTDKTDRLRSLAGSKKLVLFAGSAVRYAYDSPALETAFPAYRVANMGVFAYTNILPQAEIVRTFLEEGDVLLSSPEFDACAMQFGTTRALDANLYAMVESDYDLFALLDLRHYEEVFDSMMDFLRVKHSSEILSYDVSPRSFDDDGNEVGYDTYNDWGDYVLLRPNAAKDEMHRQIPADYTVSSFPLSAVQALNAMYGDFLSMGVKVFFTYAPRNRSSLTPESTPAAIAALDAYLREHLCVPMISDIAQSLMSGIYFHVIDNHLSTEGVTRFMDYILKDLAAVL